MYVIDLSMPYYLSESKDTQTLNSTETYFMYVSLLQEAKCSPKYRKDSILMLASNWWLSPLSVTSNLLIHTLVSSALIFFLKKSDSVPHSVLWCTDPKLYFPKVTESFAVVCSVDILMSAPVLCYTTREMTFTLIRRDAAGSEPWSSWLTVFTRSTEVHHVPVS